MIKATRKIEAALGVKEHEPLPAGCWREWQNIINPSQPGADKNIVVRTFATGISIMVRADAERHTAVNLINPLVVLDR
jgi:hypothetical protein